jgi:hypothetical protein
MCEGDWKARVEEFQREWGWRAEARQENRSSTPDEGAAQRAFKSMHSFHAAEFGD